MALSRRIARPLLASIFIAEGVDAVRNPADRVKAAEVAVAPLRDYVPSIPDDPELLVRATGAIQVGAGVLLAVGRFRRLAALALIGSIVPTTYASYRFWEEDDPTVRAEQRTHFFKNLSLVGGLLLAAMDTEGEPSIGWRTKRRAQGLGTAAAGSVAATTATAQDALADAARVGSRAARKARRQGGGQVGNGRRLSRAAGSKSLDVARHAGESTVAAARTVGSAAGNAAQEWSPVVVDATRRAGSAAGAAVQHVSPTVVDAAHRAGSAAVATAHDVTPVVVSAAQTGAQLAAPYVATGVDLATDLLTKLSEHLPND